MSEQEIKEALELIKDADTSTANYHLLEHEQKKALARIENRAPEWLRAQQTLIDQQAQKIRDLTTGVKEYEFWIKNIGNPAKECLELAKKTLGWYADKENYTRSENDVETGYPHEIMWD